MKVILSGTDRKGANSLIVAKQVQAMYKELGEDTHLINLSEIGLDQLNGPQYGTPEISVTPLQQAVEKINNSDGIIVVVPEYNGSYPGILKYFIDHWQYPLSFEHRPVCFIGLGGQWGGLRPVEHLQGVFGYRNAFMFPDRVFLCNVWNLIQDNKILDPKTLQRLQSQCERFSKFVKALRSENLIPASQ